MGVTSSMRWHSVAAVSQNRVVVKRTLRLQGPYVGNAVTESFEPGRNRLLTAIPYEHLL
jgi:hypothetical protein